MSSPGAFGMGTFGGAAFTSTVGGNLTNGGDAVYTTDASGNVTGLSGVSLGNYSAGPSAPISDVVLADSGVVGLPNGQYWGKVTFVTVAGETDSIASIGASLTVANKKINWYSIPVSTDPTVISRNLYRTVAGADSVTDPREYFLAGTITNNTTTTYVDNLADGSLGVAIPGANTAAPYISRNGARIGNFVGNSYGFGAGSFATGRGYASIYLGFNSGGATTTAKRNAALGAFSMAVMTTGSRNFGGGVHTFNSATTVSDSVAVGFASQFSQVLNPTFPNATAGSYSLNLMNNGTGGNTAMGFQAGQLGAGLNQCCLFGMNAGRNLTGAANVLAGVNAGITASSSNFLAGFGHQSLNSVTTASSVVAYGPYSGNYATSVSNEFFLNNQDRTNYAGDQTLSLMYGVFASTAIAQRLALNALVKHAGVPVASLPAATAGLQGYRGYVTDASATTFYSTVAGGGANIVPVFCNGTSWVIA